MERGVLLLICFIVLGRDGGEGGREQERKDPGKDSRRRVDGRKEERKGRCCRGDS